ncbi:cobalt-zinc-cadmium resistance protein [Francisella sp. W12-1067]|nr:cobalt-zinc-cadmium resistance protein [Francisella sp. W12-1067]
MFINALLAIVKVLVGVVGRSPALFADGIHSFSDLLSDAMVLFAAKYANKEEDHNHPYGHERIETLATLILSGLLIAIGFMIVYHSVVSLMTGDYNQPNSYTAFAAIFSIVGNEFIYQYTMAAANKINSDLLRANAWHSRSDMWSSVVVLVGLLGAFAGFVWMDALAAFVVCYMIVKMGIKWGYSAVAELIDEGVDEQTYKAIKEIIASIEDVRDFHYLRTRKMAGKIVLDVHILVDKYCTASEGHYIAEVVKSNIYHKVGGIKDITVHVDVLDHEIGVVKLENFEPSRAQIYSLILNFFATNGLSKSLILDKQISIYYFDEEIIVDLYVKWSNDLRKYIDQLKNLAYENYKIRVNLYCQL